MYFELEGIWNCTVGCKQKRNIFELEFAREVRGESHLKVVKED